MTGQPRDRATQKKWARYRYERNAKLDALLRKVLKVGLGHLSAAEAAYLERVSAELKRELEIMDEELEVGPDLG